jgi:endonuclease-8
MPEGDTLHQTAARLHQALAGTTVERVSGSHRDVARHGGRITGARITAVASAGKHLLVGFDNGWTLRTHLGMPGSWHLYRAGERWRRSPGAARVVLHTAEWEAVCFAAPTVQLGPAQRVRERIAHLGPDAGADGFDPAEVLRRARAGEQQRTAADLLLDQSVLAGVGNVLKAEVLFLEGIDPRSTVADLDDAAILALAGRSDRLLRANRRPGPRNTTGMRGRDRDLWVAGRSGRPCLRCGTAIVEAWVGDPARITTWCPRCQPQR